MSLKGRRSAVHSRGYSCYTMLPLPRLLTGLLVFGLWATVGVLTIRGQTTVPPDTPLGLQQFDTDLSNTTVDLSTLKAGGPSKDGIPSLTGVWTVARFAFAILGRDGLKTATPEASGP